MQSRWIAVSIACLALIAAATWYWWPASKPPADPVVVQAQALQNKLTETFNKPGQMKDQVKTLTELRDSFVKMTPEQRREVMMGPGGPRAIIRNQAQAYADLPPEKKKEYLDKRIKEMEEFMTAMRQVGPPAGGGGGPPRDLGGGGTRKERTREMLNKTTPEERAVVSEYFTALMARRKELGLPGFGPR